jgi:ribosomal protein S27AE
MVKLKTAHCPRCGAEVKLDARRQQATCAYCGVTSYAERASVPGAPTVVIKAHATVYLSLALGLMAVIVAGVAIGTVGGDGARSVEPASMPAAEPLPAPPTAAAPKPPPLPKTQLRIASFLPARLVDSDGDKRDELLVPIELTREGKRTQHVAVYAVPSGELLRRTVALEEPQRGLLAVTQQRLVVAQPDGQLRGYDLVSGDEQWSTALGERVAALCEADVADAIHVATDDDRNLLVDVKTGRQTATRTKCKVPLAISGGRGDPRDRRDYRAPHEVAAYRCGGVRVMGSENYTVPDACLVRAKVDSDRLDGMVGHALWSFGNAWLVFGVRKPGTYVPMVGLYERGRWRWKSEVPASNPLEAEQGGPRTISLRGDSLLIGYDGGRPERHYVTRFVASDGTRSWTAALPEGASSLLALLQGESAVVAHTGQAVLMFSPADGSLLTTLGPTELAHPE